ncbi:glutamine amidotransferase [Vibrio sp. 10N.286.55.E10]|uniref:DJ-1/PfpI family protein n=1 Tax=unclassified Vibrio TaxID=2614977 RepID=UPI000C826172|nr:MULTISPECIES: DJ-1/PfpI family protein [unclassified Vibrio]PME27445.1 glutamine amidotransferase [Vibrio sp. 10N.286.55.E12]PME36804.1 glutamine amidotransferase [Vibrio sp. 10N.286.55.E10]PME69548.1 glutamine amidotransferase [Vibrio sp. 10N.286.55.C11]
MNIGIYIYNQAEVLDFSGPFEVFSTAKRLGAEDLNVFLISETAEPVIARGGFKVLPDYSLNNHPKIDLLMVVGGIHTDEMNKPNVLDWISSVSESASQVVSVCTGAFLLAKAGLLEGLTVTTHWEDISDLAQQFPSLNVNSDKRWVASGKFTTSGGISAGIDMSLHLVSVHTGLQFAKKVARQMEYSWQECK